MKSCIHEFKYTNNATCTYPNIHSFRNVTCLFLSCITIKKQQGHLPGHEKSRYRNRRDHYLKYELSVNLQLHLDGRPVDRVK